MKPSPAERWNRWQDDDEATNGDRGATDWARRGDGALMLQDEWGWFAMVTNPTTGEITAQSADRGDPTTHFEVYCEPVWLSWAADEEQARVPREDT